jgi:hypothetical protein
MAEIMASMDWWRLRPVKDMLVEQPGSEDIKRTVVTARTEAGDLALCYVPSAGELGLNCSAMSMPCRLAWVDVRSGVWHDAGVVAGDLWRGSPPAAGDWLLVMRR